MDFEDVKLPPLSRRVVCAFGQLVLDQVVVMGEALPIGGQIRGATSVRPGGCAPNVALTAAAEGAQARFVGHIGNGPYQSEMTHRLEAQGVEIAGVREGKYASCLALHFYNGETTYITHPGDSYLLSSDAVSASWLDNAAVLHVTGYELFDSTTADASLKIIRLARERDIPISFDIALSNELDRFGISRFCEMLREEIQPTVLFCNEQEGEILNISHPFPTGVGVVVQHRSMAPTRIFLPGNSPFECKVPSNQRFDDTIGGGDAFAGGFIASWLREETLRENVDHAHAASLQLLKTVNKVGTSDPQ